MAKSQLCSVLRDSTMWSPLNEAILFYKIRLDIASTEVTSTLKGGNYIV